MYGSYFDEVNLDSEPVAADLTALAYQTPLIVRALVQRNDSRLVSDVTSSHRPLERIVTDYQLLVLEVMKGERQLNARNIILRLPGGRVGWSDGTFAETRATGLRRPLNQEEYVMFLKPSDIAADEGRKDYSLSAGAQSLFQVKPGGVIEPKGNRRFHRISQTVKKDYFGFYDDLMTAIRESERIRAKEEGKGQGGL